MRAAFFHPQFKGVGGAEVLIAAQAQFFVQHGHDVRLISHIQDRARWERAFAGVTLAAFQTDLPSQWYLPRALRIERALPRVLQHLQGCDAVLAHNFPSCALLGMADLPPTTTRAWYCNEPNRQLHLVESTPFLHARVQANPPSSAAERAYAHKLRWNQLLMRTRPGRRTRELDLAHSSQVAIICANSQYTRDNVQRIYGRSDAHVIPPIIDFPKAGRARTGIDRTRGLQVLAHARLDPIKNLDHVVSGFALYARQARGAQLHVVGVGRQRRALERLSQQLGVAAAVRFHGFLPQPELERVYDACDVFALTSLDEPFGMVFPEAAARGLILIGTDHAGPAEILDGGALGYTCDPFAPQALTEQLQRIAAASDADHDALRARAAAACVSRYSASTVGPMLLRLLQP
jgi:glycosyltransferase involved in cell wall biosynthesis